MVLGNGSDGARKGDAHRGNVTYQPLELEQVQVVFHGC